MENTKGSQNIMEQEWVLIYQLIKSNKYKRIANSVHGFQTYIDYGFITTKEGINAKGKRSTFCKVSDVDNLFKLLTLLDNDYFSEYEVRKKLGFMEGEQRGEVRHLLNANIVDLCESERIDYKYFDQPLFSGRVGNYRFNLFVNKKQLEQFLDNHIERKELKSKYSLTDTDLVRLEKTFGIKRIQISRHCSFYPLGDVMRWKETEEAKRGELGQYYKVNQLVDISGMNRKSIIFLIEEGYLDTMKLKGKYYITREVAETFLEEIQIIRDKYCLWKDLKAICGANPRSLRPIPLTVLAGRVLGSNGTGRYMYALEEAYGYKKRLDLDIEISKVVDELIDEPMECFEGVIRIKKISFSNSPFTEKEWYSFVKEKLKLTRTTKERLRYKVKAFADSTELLSEITKKQELYALFSNDINLNLFNDSVPRFNQQHFYSFLLEFHEKVRIQVHEKKTKINTFDISKINNPYKYDRAEQPKSTYSYSEYVKVYDFAKQMTHKHPALIDAANIINRQVNVNHYASSWLYVLTHLGNAWRHGDIVTMPMLDSKTINKFSLETLKQRDLTFEEAESIVNEIKRKDLTVNKTNVVNRFNCPDDILIPFATAYVISSIIAMEYTGVILKENNKGVNTHIDFGVKNEGYFPKKTQNAFFREFELGDFSFENRKMNRTVLVLMYMVVVKKGRGQSALELAQRLRSHGDFESTNIYLVIPEDELDALCESLFDRKQFGYIPDLMATILLGNNQDRDSRTKEIIALNSTFGGIHKIQATSGFINKMIAERKKVADEIYSMGFDKALEIMDDLKLNALASNEENFQCLVSPDCRYPELESCKDCPFSIPNFYAISSLVKGVKSTILEFISEFSPNTFEGEKTRLMNSLYRDMDNLEHAMQKFGQLEVFNFFEGGKEEYDSLLDLIDELQSRTGEEFEKYLTYNPIYLT